MTTYELELDHLKKKVSMMVQLKCLDPCLAVAYEELSKDVLFFLEWDWQRALERQEELKRKEQLRRQDVLKKCFERKEAQCVQPTNKTLDGYIKTDPRVKRSRDPDPESLEKKVRAPQTEKCKRCKETDVHYEVKEGVKVCCYRFHVIHPLSFFLNPILFIYRRV